MLVEVDDNQMHFQVVSRTGETVDRASLCTNGKTESLPALWFSSPPFEQHLQFSTKRRARFRRR